MGLSGQCYVQKIYEMLKKVQKSVLNYEKVVLAEVLIMGL